LVQPLIAPLFEGKSAHEVLALFTDNYDRKPYDIVKDFWRGPFGGGGQLLQDPRDRIRFAGGGNGADDFESWWREVLHDGFIAASAMPPTHSVSLKSDWASGLNSHN